jgi:hypothetical protein
MNTKIAVRLIVAIGALGLAGTAAAQQTIHDYLSDTALRVQATDNPVQKRAILDERLHAMDRAIDMVTDSPLTSTRDDLSLGRIKLALQEKTDELTGANGFERVPDDQLNAFSAYVVQDMEQADRTISISVVTLLLIIIIVLLI